MNMQKRRQNEPTMFRCARRRSKRRGIRFADVPGSMFLDLSIAWRSTIDASWLAILGEQMFTSMKNCNWPHRNSRFDWMIFRRELTGIKLLQ